MSLSLFRLKRTFALGMRQYGLTYADAERFRNSVPNVEVIVPGFLLGLAIPLLVTHFGDMPTVITSSSLILAFGISAGVGVTFGLYPAYRAANMDPIESLRHE
jgi:ABC-type lipoprotein release transport system permease subunit